MNETNAERLGRIKSNGLVGTQELGYGTVESVDGLREGDFQWLVEQAELAQKPNGVAIYFNETIRLDRENDSLRGRARELDDENKLLREATKLKDKVLSFYAAAPTYEIRPDGKGGMYVDIEEDKGYRARMHLRRGSHASGKDKDTTTD